MIQWTFSRSLATIILHQSSIFDKIQQITKMSYSKYHLNPSKSVRMDRVFFWLAGLLLVISFGIWPMEIPRRGPANPWKTPSFPTLVLGLTQSFSEIMNMLPPEQLLI